MGVAPTKEQLEKAYAECQHVPTLAKKFGVTPNCLYANLYKFGLREPVEKNRIKDPNIELEGWTDDEVMGVAEALIKYAIKDYKYALKRNNKGDIYSLEVFFHSRMFSLCCDLLGQDVETIIRKYLKLDE